jgi:hypothetical protein
VNAGRIDEIQRQLAQGLERIDPHHRLLGRPTTFRVIDGRALEITFKDVAGIAEAEAQGVKRVLGAESYYSVSPQTAEHVTVRFVVPL